MPCTVDASLANAEVERSKIEANRRKFGLALTDWKVATEAACQACRLLEQANAMGGASDFLRAWWAEHKRFDREREASGESVDEYIARVVREYGAAEEGGNET